jgi:hypothetical protein
VAPLRPAPVDSKGVRYLFCGQKRYRTPSIWLLGISYHRANPAESRALLWAPDGTQQWVRQGATNAMAPYQVGWKASALRELRRINRQPAPRVFVAIKRLSLIVNSGPVAEDVFGEPGWGWIVQG